MNKTVIRIGNAAARIGVHPQTLRRWEREGRIHRATRNALTGQRRYEEADIERLIELVIGRQT